MVHLFDFPAQQGKVEFTMDPQDIKQALLWRNPSVPCEDFDDVLGYTITLV
jgi:hypothetical protein